ncbi:MAG: protease modulator HflC [Magnetococcales bacterium]|nr:protease modulator HflC [Magnetococcales bacterium]MBF0148641.1 protease modulator HflC [Magnetococcales bacterium]MBF0172719.1 protease modulator HflC [Magnetococcales bacterium]MBF0346858.1 protease modulator HflC [Magnetococcales bacterium]MBF0630883.1 protease modulator HflC [Magnetococcales bacterium]
MTFLIVGGIILLSQSVFMVHQVQQVLILQLGKPVRSVSEPGLHFKIPFLQDVYSFEKRLLVFDQEPQEILSADKKNLKVDSYSRWRIVDTLKFYQTVRNEIGAASRINDIIYSNLREVLGQFTMMEIVAGAREDLMARIRTQANLQSSKYGIEVLDVRIKRTDLPAENSKAVFKRMQTERERQAKQYRAEGEEEAVKIRSSADKDKEILLAEAFKTSEKIRGAGDAEAASIYAEAYKKNSRFYEFKRTLEAYQKAFAEDTTLLVQPSGFYRFLQEDRDGGTP